MGDISEYVAAKLIAYAAAHGADATRAMAKPWGLTTAQVVTFCRENSVAIKRARIALSASSSRTSSKGKQHGVS